MNRPESGYPNDAWQLLANQMSTTRRHKMEAVAAQRTKHIQVVLQDVHDPHNVSACLRSAEAFGVLNAHIVTMAGRYQPGKVARGANRWLNLHRYDDVASSVSTLKKKRCSSCRRIP